MHDGHSNPTSAYWNDRSSSLPLESILPDITCSVRRSHFSLGPIRIHTARGKVYSVSKSPANFSVFRNSKGYFLIFRIKRTDPSQLSRNNLDTILLLTLLEELPRQSLTHANSHLSITLSRIRADHEPLTASKDEIHKLDKDARNPSPHELSQPLKYHSYIPHARIPLSSKAVVFSISFFYFGNRCLLDLIEH